MRTSIHVVVYAWGLAVSVRPLHHVRACGRANGRLMGLAADPFREGSHRLWHLREGLQNTRRSMRFRTTQHSRNATPTRDRNGAPRLPLLRPKLELVSAQASESAPKTRCARQCRAATADVLHVIVGTRSELGSARDFFEKRSGRINSPCL